MRVYRALVPPAAKGRRMEEYLAKAMPLLPQHVIRDVFKNRDVKMDGKRASRDTEALPGTRVEVYTAYEPRLPVVYEDERILLVNKPAGISCQEDLWGGMTVLSLLESRAGGAYAPRLCHRLDNPTTGLLLLCKDDESEQLLFEAFRDRKLIKVYECLVRGEMRPKAAVAEAYLLKETDKNRVRVISHSTPGALPIATQYETLFFQEGISRLRVTLLTGRTHQIRAHMSFLSHPLLGDDEYGDWQFNKRMKAGGLKLCATQLILNVGGCLSYLDGQTFSVQPPF